MKRIAAYLGLIALVLMMLVVSVQAEDRYIPNIRTSQPLKCSTGNGASAGSDVTVVEYGAQMLHKTVFTLDEQAVALTDNTGTIAYGGLKVYDFPEGAVMVVGVTSDLDLTKSSDGVNDDWDGDFGLGTVTATDDASLTTTEDDILPSTATPQATSGATTANGQSTAAENVVFDGTDTAKDMFLNFLVDDSDHDVDSTACNLIADGTITLYWINLGDY